MKIWRTSPVCHFSTRFADDRLFSNMNLPRSPSNFHSGFKGTIITPHPNRPFVARPRTWCAAMAGARGATMCKVENGPGASGRPAGRPPGENFAGFLYKAAAPAPSRGPPCRRDAPAAPGRSRLTAPDAGRRRCAPGCSQLASRARLTRGCSRAAPWCGGAAPGAGRGSVIHSAGPRALQTPGRPRSDQHRK